MRIFPLPIVVASLLVLAACNVGSDDTSTLPTAFVAPPVVTAAPSRGAMLARDLCSGCHGESFSGATVGATSCPSLRALGAYSTTEFADLLRNGVARGGDQVDSFMSLNVEIDDNDIPVLLEYLKRAVAAR